MHSFFSDIVFNLLTTSRRRQFMATALSQNMTSLEWLQQYCTIRAAGPRGVGHSYTAARLCEYFGAGKFLLLGANEGIVNRTREMADPKCFQFETIPHCTSVFGEWLIGRKAVIIDAAAVMPDNVIAAHYQVAAAMLKPGDEFYFIHLG